jgi:hypothetical protein
MRFRSPLRGGVAAVALSMLVLAAITQPAATQTYTPTFPASTYAARSDPAPAAVPAPNPSAGPQTPQTPQRPTRTPEEQQREQQQQQQQEQQQQEQNQPSPESGQGLAAGGESVAATSNVLGDQLGLPPIVFRPKGRNGGVAVPAVRSFKIAEDESARPQDRVYLDFNFYDNVNRSVNERLGSAFHNIDAYRETFGFEKTFLNGDGSIGMRLPLNTVTAESTTPGLGGSDSTDIGDLSIITKYAFWRDRQTGSLLSAGLAVTVPTGPDRFADSDVFFPVHTTVLTPYLGFYFRRDRWYTQGFVSLDVPVENTDVTILHNDVQIGYVLHRNTCEDAFLTAVIPDFEVHVNDPLNHRGALNPLDPVGTPDWVDLTAGVTFEFRRQSTLALGFVTPVTGPKPYDFEVLAQFNYRFGCTAAQARQPSNVLGE